jgi:hypothetical protein
MRNRISFYKHYPWSARLSRTALAAILALEILAAGLSAGQSPAGRVLPGLTLPGVPSPALGAVILPRHAPTGAYQLALLDEPIEAARARVRSLLAPGAVIDTPPGAWTIKDSGPLDAFGDVGIYDRSKLARLFGGKPARLVRAPIERDGRVVASLTLIAPYPDPQLTRLLPGTLAILFVLDPPKPQGPKP